MNSSPTTFRGKIAVPGSRTLTPSAFTRIVLFRSVALRTTPPNADFAFDTRETTRQTTAGFLEATDGVKIAVNANFYSPFNAQTIAAPGDSNLCGLAVCDGVVESKPEKGFPSFIQTKDGKLAIRNVDPE